MSSAPSTVDSPTATHNPESTVPSSPVSDEANDDTLSKSASAEANSTEPEPAEAGELQDVEGMDNQAKALMSLLQTSQVRQ